MHFDTLYDRLIKGEEKLALIGLGYVGMPIAVEFAKLVILVRVCERISVNSLCSISSQMPESTDNYCIF